jgi:HSP20 family molecular chaperone IbpA
MMRLMLRTGLWSSLSANCSRLQLTRSAGSSQLLSTRTQHTLWARDPSTVTALSSARFGLIWSSAQRRPFSKDAKQIDADKLKQEIVDLEQQIVTLKQRLTPSTSTSIAGGPEGVQIEITDRQIGDSDEELNVYRLAYDFPGFKSKNIRVTVVDNMLQIYAFQTTGKKSEAGKDKPAEYIYEHTNEEILPDEVSADKVSASFDAENGFLVIEAILPDEVPSAQVLADTRKRNEQLSKAREQIEKKQKALRKALQTSETESSSTPSTTTATTPPPPSSDKQD